jgi:hypothetical protein
LYEAGKDLKKQGEPFSALDVWKAAGYVQAPESASEAELDYAKQVSELSFLRKINESEEEIISLASKFKNINIATRDIKKHLGLKNIPTIAKYRLEFLILSGNPNISI